jgi:hypothetical protein
MLRATDLLRPAYMSRSNALSMTLLAVASLFAASAEAGPPLGVCPWMTAASLQAYSEACFPEQRDEHRVLLDEMVSRLGEFVRNREPRQAKDYSEFKSRAWSSVRSKVDMNPELCRDVSGNDLLLHYKAFREIEPSAHRNELSRMLNASAEARPFGWDCAR